MKHSSAELVGWQGLARPWFAYLSPFLTRYQGPTAAVIILAGLIMALAALFIKLIARRAKVRSFLAVRAVFPLFKFGVDSHSHCRNWYRLSMFY
ncbi:hypothetical protein [Aeromonas hydrophila]|uniref:hypothetical protein n=1 Tax=Aeromonas hydrophila TaxID=644 RepID=UPI003D230A73